MQKLALLSQIAPPAGWASYALQFRIPDCELDGSGVGACGFDLFKPNGHVAEVSIEYRLADFPSGELQVTNVSFAGDGSR